MPACAVFGCGNYTRKTKDTDIQYFGFPINDDMSKRWIHACKRKDKFNVKHACICSVHFHPTSFAIPLREQLLNYKPKNRRNLKLDALPTENMPSTANVTQNLDETPRSSRQRNRNRGIEIAEILNTNVNATETATDENISNIEIISEQNKDDEIRILREKISQLEIKNCELKRSYDNVLLDKNKISAELNETKRGFLDKVNNILSKIFTPGQIESLLHPTKKKKQWSTEDIASAISLRSISPKAYRYLRNNNFPLPALSTLRTWASTLNLDQGVLHEIIMLMKNKSRDLTSVQRLTVLTFDEIYLSNRICIDIKNQQRLGPHKRCQTVMARGLIANWKQPVFYGFDESMAKDRLNEIISKLHDASFTVVAITSDMAPGNLSLWSSLNIGHNKNCFFEHPSDSNKNVYVFADPPHLLKLIRNHWLDNGFLTNGIFVNRACFEKILTISSTEITIAHKISRYHLDVKGTERQKVRPAAQLLSSTIGKAIQFCGIHGYMNHINWEETSKLVILINNWFDLFNSKSKFGDHSGRNAFGVNLETQISLLHNLSEQIGSMTVGKHKNLVPFQKGIILSNKSLIQLYYYLKTNYDLEYIITYRLNQDILENFFSYIRGMGGPNDHPTALDIKHRLKWYILGKHSAAVFSENKNTEENVGENVLVKPLHEAAENLNSEIDITCISQNILTNYSNIPEKPDNLALEIEEENLLLYSFVEPAYDCSEADTTNFEMSSDHLNLLEEFETIEFRDTINKEGLKYIAGYAAYRFRDKYPHLGVPTKKLANASSNLDWIQFISRGNLLYPSDKMILTVNVLNSEFIRMHGDYLSNEKNMFSSLAQNTIYKLPERNYVPPEVVLCLARTRIFIRLRDINRKISFENCKRKLGKKMSKFTNCKT